MNSNAVLKDRLQHPVCGSFMGGPGVGNAALLHHHHFVGHEGQRDFVQHADHGLALGHQGAHQQAMAAAYTDQYFSESLFVRMRLLEQQGQWPRPNDLRDGPADGGSVHQLPVQHRQGHRS